jgi:hypothetical protein
MRPLSRRFLLHGSLKTALALPWLEAMQRKALGAQTNPGRFVLAFGGISTQTHKTGLIVPTAGAVDWSNTMGLRPVFQAGLQGDAALVSKLTIPWKASEFDGQPARRDNGFHHGSIAPLLSGITAQERDLVFRGKSADSVMAEVLSPGIAQLAYRVQYDYYKGSISNYALSYDGANKPRVPRFSPSKAYQDFSTAISASDDERKKRLFEQSKGRSVLDMVKSNAATLERKLGAEDRRRLDSYFTSLREFEQRLQQGVAGKCEPIRGFPGDDTAFKTVVEGINIRDGARCANPDADGEEGDAKDICRRVGYSFETERGNLFVDLLALAFQCDLARSASLMVTYQQTFLSAVQVMDVDEPDNKWRTNALRTKDMHEIGHDPADEGMMAYFYRWHISFLARLGQKLKETQENGAPLLDSSALVFVTEGGWGRDPESDPMNQNKNGSPHSTENMTVLVIGGKALGLKLGQHYVGNQAHPSQVILSAMRAAGRRSTLNFGEITEPFAPLLG